MIELMVVMTKKQVETSAMATKTFCRSHTYSVCLIISFIVCLLILTADTCGEPAQSCTSCSILDFVCDTTSRMDSCRPPNLWYLLVELTVFNLIARHSAASTGMEAARGDCQ